MLPALASEGSFLDSFKFVVSAPLGASFCDNILTLSLVKMNAPTDRPTSKASLLALKAEHPEAKLVVGNTEVGIEMKFKDARYPVLIGATHVPELNKVQL